MCFCGHFYRRVLTKLNMHETTQEVKNLELLKLRFGDALLHHCEIMLRDVEDSTRLNQRAPCDYLRVTVISQVFWPELSNCALTIHRLASAWLAVLLSVWQPNRYLV